MPIICLRPSLRQPTGDDLAQGVVAVTPIEWPTAAIGQDVVKLDPMFSDGAWWVEEVPPEVLA